MNRANDPRSVDAQHEGLRKKIKTAQRQLGLDDKTYRQILIDNFGVNSSKKLTITGKEELIWIFQRDHGWVPKPKRGGKRSQTLALRKRIHQIAREISFEGKRLRGLCRLKCQVDTPDWCMDNKKLLELIATLDEYKREERDGGGS